MKSKIVISENTHEWKFPCLGIIEGHGIVLLTELLVDNTAKGIVVHKIRKDWYSIGAYSDRWKIENLKPFTGIVELSND